MAAEKPDQVDLVFKALASRPRREILAILATGGGADDARCCDADEVCACVFAEKLGLGAPTVSHHMKTLLEAGLVSASKRGLWVYYRLVPETIERVVAEFSGLIETGCASPKA
jgi:ArsR family transcriptional regulator, arsenate/arsenite/antimonite-responsive transcriptional repressor